VKYGLVITCALVVTGVVLAIIGAGRLIYARESWFTMDPRFEGINAPRVSIETRDPIVRGSLLYATMLTGIVLGQLFNYTIARPNRQIHLEPLFRSLNTGRSWAAMLASPVVFFMTFPTVIVVRESVVYFYALQTGFFCLSILDGVAKRFEASPPQTPNQQPPRPDA